MNKQDKKYYIRGIIAAMVSLVLSHIIMQYAFSDFVFTIDTIPIGIILYMIIWVIVFSLIILPSELYRIYKK